LTTEPISNEVRAFVADNVRSLIALELLLIMQADPGREWSAAELTRELRAAAEWTAGELQFLSQRGLLAPVEGDPARYRYAPRRPELSAAVSQLASLYPQYRFSIMQIIVAAPSKSIQSFADAFKLRKEGADG
jgi:hypothetical protein